MTKNIERIVAKINRANQQRLKDRLKLQIAAEEQREKIKNSNA